MTLMVHDTEGAPRKNLAHGPWENERIFRLGETRGKNYGK